MCSNRPARIAASVIGAIFLLVGGAANLQAQSPAAPGATEPLDPATLKEVKALYRKLIDAENRHDLAEVRTMVWDSPTTLSVTKTATTDESN